MQPQEIFSALFGNRPFFGGETSGIQKAVLEENLVLTALVSCAVRPGCPVRVLEVGSWIGFSALTWAHAIDMLSPEGGRVTCLDPWEPYFGDADISSGAAVYRRMDNLAKSGLAFELFRHNVSCGPLRVAIDPIRGQSRDVLPSLASGSFDVVYLDGSHYYGDVKADLEQSIGLVSVGGVLCGDDLDLQIGDIDRDKAVAHIDRDYVKDEHAGWYHPGVTLAIDECFGRVAKHGRTWFMQKTGTKEFAPPNLASARMAIPPHWPAEWQKKAQMLLR